jgi:hypothetical protein
VKWKGGREGGVEIKLGLIFLLAFLGQMTAH